MNEYFKETYDKIINSDTNQKLDNLSESLELEKYMLDDTYDYYILHNTIILQKTRLLTEQLLDMSGSTIIIMTGESGDFDPETENLKSMMEEESKDIRDGNVFTLSDIKKD